MLTHPLVLHFWEEHGGSKQEVLMRILSAHLTPADRQVQESVNILAANKNPEESLNQKSEWGGAKIPGLDVRTPKGLHKGKINVDGRSLHQIDLSELINEAKKRGKKRLQYSRVQ